MSAVTKKKVDVYVCCYIAMRNYLIWSLSWYTGQTYEIVADCPPPFHVQVYRVTSLGEG